MHTYKKKTKKEDTGLHPVKVEYVPGKITIVETPSHRKIRMNTFVGNTNSQVFCTRFSNDDKMVVTGTIDGDIKVYDVYESKTLTLCKSWKKDILPTTCLRWKPPKGNANSNNFISTCADGSLTWFDVAGDVLHRETMDHALLCCDYSPLGEFVAVGRDDFSICVFDQEHHKLITTYEGSSEDNDTGGHSNRVFSIKCVPDQPNVFLSGGWDSKIRYWDVRQKESIRSFYGPHISGDSIDYKSGQILTGSYRNEEILQLWSFKNASLIKTIQIDVKEHPAAYCYTAQFGKKESSLIGMGMTGCNQIQLYDSKKDYALCGELQMQGPCFTIDFSNSGNMFVCSGAEGVVYILSID